jgi:uncharacterized membrane protein YvbJ
MSFCPICGRDHGPNRLCVDIAGETLDKTGIEKHSKTDKDEFEKIRKQAERSMLKVLLLIAIVLALIFFLLSR